MTIPAPAPAPAPAADHITLLGKCPTDAPAPAVVDAKLYSLPRCVQCNAMKRGLGKRSADFEEINMAINEEAADLVRSLGIQEAPFTVLALSDGTNVAFTGNRPDVLDYYFGKVLR